MIDQLQAEYNDCDLGLQNRTQQVNGGDVSPQEDEGDVSMAMLYPQWAAWWVIEG